MTCPTCGADASGKFCSACGSPLSGSTCGQCGASLSPGARFCHACGGSAVATAPRHAPLPWIIAGVAVIGLLVVLALSRLNPSAGTPASVAATPAGPGRVDLASMSPRERADALFNRVADAAERGVRDTALFFKPMALEAYRMLGTLDPDARYHVGVIHLATDDYPAVLAQADSIEQTVPQHLFAAILRAEVARGQNDTEALRRAYAAFLANLEAERAANRPEYDEHPGMLDRFVTEARAGGRQ
ncbi:MAG TPA: zinc ribbon domain-containing protein [Gemmatimonadales bacterium]